MIKKKSGNIKHIIIASTLVIVAVFIGLLTYEKPINIYEVKAEGTLRCIVEWDYFSELDDLDEEDVVLIDVRRQFEYERGHLDNAINMSAADILSEENQARLTAFEDDGKNIVLYGCTPEEANIPFMMLYQLGYENIKLLPVALTYEENSLVTDLKDVESQEYDINYFIKRSVKKAKEAEEAAKLAAAPPPPVKKQVVVKPKKKKKPEGGC
jgi:rhodanese-related sulfurtransferase